MRWTGRFQGYQLSDFRKDLVSGFIVGIIAIPLGMAFAIAVGVKPEYGIYTTIVAGICISLFGGSRFQIGGPTGAFIPILFAIVHQYGYENLLIAGFLAGVILVVMGLLRLGALIHFIPRPVTIGFTTGIAVIIFTGQIANFLGLNDVKKHESFILNMKEMVMHLGTTNGYSIATALICLVVMLLTPRIFPKVPGALVGLIVSSGAAVLFFQGEVATIGSTFGDIPSTLPSLQMPEITWDRILSLMGPAFLIAMLGGIESLLSAVVADGMTGTRHHSNRELVGQGIANMVTPLFGGIPATGAIARTATNIKSGAVSPMSGVIHGVVVLLVLLLFAPYASAIPLASMAPILMVVAWNMSERKEFARILKTRTSDSLVLFVTFALTVWMDLTTAVQVGLVLSMVLFVKRMRDELRIHKVLPEPGSRLGKVKASAVREDHDCPQISIFTIEGPLFFGAAKRFEQSILASIPNHPHILLLRMSRVPTVDLTGEGSLASIVQEMEALGGVVLISGMQPQTLALLKRTGLYDRIGANHFFAQTGKAIQEALLHLDYNRCLGCQHAVFRECAAFKSMENREGLAPQDRVACLDSVPVSASRG